MPACGVHAERALITEMKRGGEQCKLSDKSAIFSKKNLGAIIEGIESQASSSQ